MSFIFIPRFFTFFFPASSQKTMALSRGGEWVGGVGKG